MEHHGDQPGSPFFKGNAALRPACLKGLDLFRRLRAVRSSHRRKQRTEFGCAVSAENGGICGQRFEIQKEGVLALRFRLVCPGSDELTEQAEGCDAAVVAGKAPVLLRPQLLHLIRVIFGIGRRAALKALRQPFVLDAGVELIDAVKKNADPVFADAGVCERLGEQPSGGCICQIGVRRGFERRLCVSAAAREACEHEADRRKDGQQLSFPIYH